MTRARRALTAILLTVATGSLTMVDVAAAGAPRRTAPGTAAQVYTVQSGDFLVGIAGRMGVKLSALLFANHLVVTSLIYPGMQLIVPTGGALPATVAAPAAPAPAPAAAAVYTVKSGDSLSAIAGRMGVKLSALLSTNSITVTTVIHPGNQLAVPAGGLLPGDVAASNPPADVASSPASALQYVVRSGDYLTGIAPALGVRVADLLSANQLTMNSVIHPGMLLSVPAGGRLPAATGSVEAAPATAPASATAGTDSRLAAVIAFAQAQVGEPYKFNSAGPDSWDCSGLTLAAYAEIGISLPHYSGAQVNLGTPVDRATQAIVAGDLIFLESSVGSGVVNHVGIAISSTQWVQATRSGDVVRMGNIPSTRVIAIRRLLPGG